MFYSQYEFEKNLHYNRLENEKHLKYARGLSSTERSYGNLKYSILKALRKTVRKETEKP